MLGSVFALGVGQQAWAPRRPFVVLSQLPQWLVELIALWIGEGAPRMDRAEKCGLNAGHHRVVVHVRCE